MVLPRLRGCRARGSAAHFNRPAEPTLESPGTTAAGNFRSGSRNALQILPQPALRNGPSLTRPSSQQQREGGNAGSSHSVEPVKHTAMPGNQGRRVRHACPALQPTFRQIPNLRRHRQHDRRPDRTGNPGCEFENKPDRSCGNPASDRSGPSFSWADGGRKLRPAQRPSAKISRRVRSDDNRNHHERNSRNVGRPK